MPGTLLPRPARSATHLATAAATHPASHGGSGPTAALAWRVIRDVPRSGAANMALDHALATCLGEGEAVLRLYSWARPTVSFGRNEPSRDRYRAEAAKHSGVEWVRRPTGGRAVVHDEELTYAVVAPIRALGGARAAYRAINDALAEALISLGAAVAVSDVGATLALDSGPCFQAPAAGEVVAAGRKLVGSAQARVEGALLQHGSIILDGDQSLLDERSGSGLGEPPATLQDLIGPVAVGEVADAVVAHMRERLSGGWSNGGYTRRERSEARRLEAERYANDEWTWRR